MLLVSRQRLKHVLQATCPHFVTIRPSLTCLRQTLHCTVEGEGGGDGGGEGCGCGGSGGGVGGLGGGGVGGIGGVGGT